jgi:hypothetical protein
MARPAALMGDARCVRSVTQVPPLISLWTRLEVHLHPFAARTAGVLNRTANKLSGDPASLVLGPDLLVPVAGVTRTSGQCC